MIFNEREHAGKILAEDLEKHLQNFNDSVILAIPRGGIPIAFQLSKSLNIPFSLIITKKLAAPSNPEFAFGAIAPDGTYLINEISFERLGISQEKFKEIKDTALLEVKSRIKSYLYGKRIDVKGKVAIVVDDGIATGYTAMVAGKYLKKIEAKKIILTIPVGPSNSIVRTKRIFDNVICSELSDSGYFAVGQYYRDFHQVPDEEMFYYINKAREENLFYDSLRKKNLILNLL